MPMARAFSMMIFIHGIHSKLSIEIITSLCLIIPWFIVGYGPLFTKWTNVLPQDRVKPRSREIRIETFPTTLKIDRHFGRNAADMPVEFYSDNFFQR